MAAAAGILELADLAGNSGATGTGTGIREERGLDRGDAVFLWLGSMAGLGNFAACCRQCC